MWHNFLWWIILKIVLNAMLTASVKLWRVPTFHRDLYKPTELLHNSVENTLLLYQHHQQDEYRCLLNHPPCFVCRQVILKIKLSIKCVIINFIFPPSAECAPEKCYKKGRQDCIASPSCKWKGETSECLQKTRQRRTARQPTHG